MKKNLVLLLLIFPWTAEAAFRLGLGSAVAHRSAELIDNAQSSLVGDAAATALPSCSGNTLYTVSPVDLADVTGIVPLGNLNPTGHTFPSDHIYPYLRPVDPLNPTGPRVSTNLYAPGDVQITEVASSEYLSATPPQTDYSIYFYSCRELKGYFYHVKSLTAAFSARVGALDRNCSTYSTGGSTIRRCGAYTNFSVTAGTLLGTVGGASGAAFDFGGYDTRIAPLAFVSPSRHYGLQLYTICPIDYFSPSIASAWTAKMGEYDGSYPRPIAPLCGTIMQDVASTAQGDWYKPGQPDYPEDPHLALVHSYVDPTYGAFSVGSSVSGLTGTHYFMPTHAGFVRRDFSEVGADGEIYCYDSFRDPRFVLTGSPFIILIQLTSPATVRIEKQATTPCGAGPWAFTSAAVDFQR